MGNKEQESKAIVVLKGANEFTKHFQYGDIELYASKAHDTKNDIHGILFAIPVIPDMGISDLYYPMEFENQQFRDEMFENLDAELIIQRIRGQIIENRKNQNENTTDGN